MGAILSYKEFLGTYKTRGHRIRHLENYKKLFPIKSSPSFSGIVADLIADGNLQGDPKWRIDFTSKSKNELRRFEKEIKRLFFVKGKIRECKSNKLSKTYNLAVNCSPIARILYLCGVPAGQKVLTKFAIPNWVLNDKECFRIFCRRFFSCEGTIMNEKNRKTPQIRLNFWKSQEIIGDAVNFLTQLKKYMLKYFGISSTIRIQKSRLNRKDKKVTQPVRIYIFRESVIRFFNEIGFEGQKQKDLKAILNSRF
ncbi:LAGLIDADG family homing endonuclease [Candidatus Pacearchaeota archaeon]|nr:LAGLIDADG family homing endonuclease [Candidatus Pacearchaeota archaeon]